MKVGIDISGGDFAPAVNIEGAIMASQGLPVDAIVVLIGDRVVIRKELSSRGEETNAKFEIVHAPDVITFHDHPTRAIPQKPNSSIAVGFDLLSKGEIQVFASTGNTGAMLVGSMYKYDSWRDSPLYYLYFTCN